METLKICLICTSLRPHSKSRELAVDIARIIEGAGAIVDQIDLVREKLPLYDGSELSAEQNAVLERFNAADGHVFTAGIYNWSAGAPALNFLHWVLDPEGPQHKPFAIAAAAGTRSSLLATDALARALLHECSGIQVVPPVFSFGKESAPDQPERLRTMVRLLLAHARLARALRGEE